MRKAGQFGAERLKQENLTRGIGQVVVPSHDVRDPQVCIINHRAKIVDWLAVGTHDDQIVQFVVLENYLPLNQILNDGFSLLGAFKTEGKRPGVAGQWLILSARSVVGRFVTNRERGLTFGFDLLYCAIAAVGFSLVQQSLSSLPIEPI